MKPDDLFSYFLNFFFCTRKINKDEYWRMEVDRLDEKPSSGLQVKPYVLYS